MSRTARYDRKDAFYRKAKSEGLRSRAAFKLDDLLRRAPRIPRGGAVVDLGCWPGSWLVTLAQAVGPEGRVVGIDLEPTDAVAPNAVVLVGDFCEPTVQEEIAAALGRSADAILCDAAPKLTGIRDVDQGAIEELWQGALALARRLLKPGGFMILKGFPGQEGDLFRKELRRAFADVHEVRPEGKRTTSKEFYWVAATWRGLGSPTRIASEN